MVQDEEEEVYQSRGMEETVEEDESVQRLCQEFSAIKTVKVIINSLQVDNGTSVEYV